MTRKPGKTDQWMPLDIGDYLGDTRHLSTLEHGAYLLLLMAYWRKKGPLMDDDSKLSKITGLSMKQWLAIRETIVDFFQSGEGQLVSTRSQEEIDNVRVRSEKARASALERWNTDDANAMRTACESDAKGMLRAPALQSQLYKKESDSKESSPVLPNRDDAVKAFVMFNDVAAEIGLPLAKALTPARRSKLKTRLRECGGIDGWAQALNNLRQSPHCRGSNDRGWRADFDFMLQAKSFMRLLEGGYGGSTTMLPLLGQPEKPRESPEIVRWRGRLAGSLKADYWDFATWGDPWNDPRHEVPQTLLDEFPALRDKHTKLRLVK